MWKGGAASDPCDRDTPDQHSVTLCTLHSEQLAGLTFV